MSDTKKNIIAYISFSLLLIIINFIYAKFSHNVSSIYMTYMFIIPLVGAALSLISKNKSFHNLLGAGILTITLSSFLEGIIEIAGTDTVYVYVLLGIGILLLLISLIKIKNVDN